MRLVDKNLAAHPKMGGPVIVGGRRRDLSAAEDAILSMPVRIANSPGTPVPTVQQDATVDTGTQIHSLSTTDFILTAPLGGHATGPARYVSSNPAIASINASGVVTPIAEGITQVTATLPGLNPRQAVLTVAFAAGGNGPRFMNFNAGTLGAHLVGQITGLLGLQAEPVPNLPSYSSPPPYSSLYSFAPDGTRNAGVWTGGLDTSCIPRASEGCLIAPDLMVFASHRQEVDGISVTFMDMAGNSYVRTVASRLNNVGATNDGNDITVARLNAALPAGIVPATLLPANFRSYLPQPQYGYPLLFTTQDETLLLGDYVGVNPTVGTSDLSMVQSSDPARSPWFYPVRWGDSGMAAFFVVNGSLSLATLWHYSGAGPVYSDNIAAINAAAGTLGSAGVVTTPNLAAFSTF